MRHSIPTHRQGMTAVLAMLYLVLFSTMALGFYASFNTAVQVVGNEQKAVQAQAAAESGMQFIRYHLSHLDIPYDTPADQLFGKVYDQLAAKIGGTANVGGQDIGLTNDLRIAIPADQSTYVYLDDSARFRVTIEQMAAKLRVRVTGRGDNAQVTRTVQLDYGIAQNASAIFDYGVASRGKIFTKGSARIRGATDPTKGSVLSTSTTDPIPVDIQGKEVSGDISVTNPNATVRFDGASVGGTSNANDILANHVHKGVPAPEFPTIDTAAFQEYAVNEYSGSAAGRTLTNCYIPPGKNVKFTGNTTINGVLYIQAPNKIEFSGNTTITGCIVVQNDAAFDLTNNTLSFSGSVQAQGVEQLAASYGDLRKLTGSFILAPNFAVSFTGSFGTVNGSIMASQVSMSGNAGGIVKGSVVNLDDTTLSLDGSSEIIIASTGTTNYPSGVFFGSHYAPLADTYAEVQP